MNWAMCVESCGRRAKRATGRLCNACQVRQWRERNRSWDNICSAVRYHQNRATILSRRKHLRVLAAALLLCACSFEFPETTADGIADWALLQSLPEPGPRPSSFLCTLGNLTVWGNLPNVTHFQVEGKEPVHVRSEDEITDVHMSGVLVIVVGDLLVVGGEWVRLGNCEGDE